MRHHAHLCNGKRFKQPGNLPGVFGNPPGHRRFTALTVAGKIHREHVGLLAESFFDKRKNGAVASPAVQEQNGGAVCLLRFRIAVKDAAALNRRLQRSTTLPELTPVFYPILCKKKSRYRILSSLDRRGVVYVTPFALADGKFLTAPQRDIHAAFQGAAQPLAGQNAGKVVLIGGDHEGPHPKFGKDGHA